MVNNETVKYLDIMIEGLEKKKRLLKLLLEKTEAQSKCISDNEYDDINWPQFEIYINEKESAIEKITGLDEGFDNVFERVKHELDTNKNEYKTQIKKLQELITELTDIGVKIETSENRNKADIERIMTNARLNIGQAKKNIKVSSSYIKQMYGNSRLNANNTFDSKK